MPGARPPASAQGAAGPCPGAGLAVFHSHYHPHPHRLAGPSISARIVSDNESSCRLLMPAKGDAGACRRQARRVHPPTPCVKPCTSHYTPLVEKKTGHGGPGNVPQRGYRSGLRPRSAWPRGGPVLTVRGMEEALGPCTRQCNGHLGPRPLLPWACRLVCGRCCRRRCADTNCPLCTPTQGTPVPARREQTGH